MARYRVSIIERPEGWQPASHDDVPPEPGAVLAELAEADELLAAVREAVDFNQAPQREADRRRAVVVEPGSPGRVWPSARLCTPLSFKVTAIWWPHGWEPNSPLDVPNCLWQAHGEPGRETMSYKRALATVRALNRQSMDSAGTMWYVPVAVEKEPVSRTVSLDAVGMETTVEVRRFHVVRPGSGSGDCSLCPAHQLDCATEPAASHRGTVSEESTRAFPAQL
ncbi:MAG: hypothetical protein ACYTG0_05450 [Planctomycetota bacterium]